MTVNILGLNFPNPIGLAAGYDKNAKIIPQLMRIGFGFIEVGAVTPKPQSGNPKPRLFRLDEDLAIVNRLGFNNLGMNDINKRLTLMIVLLVLILVPTKIVKIFLKIISEVLRNIFFS